MSSVGWSVGVVYLQAEVLSVGPPSYTHEEYVALQLVSLLPSLSRFYSHLERDRDHECPLLRSPKNRWLKRLETCIPDPDLLAPVTFVLNLNSRPCFFKLLWIVRLHGNRWSNSLEKVHV